MNSQSKRQHFSTLYLASAYLVAFTGVGAAVRSPYPVC